LDPLEPRQRGHAPDARRLGEAAQQRAGDNRSGDDRGPPAGHAGQHRVAKQRAKLIAGERSPAIRARHHDGQPVGVRVIGQDQVGPL